MQKMSYKGILRKGGFIVKKKVICIISAVLMLALVCSIIAANVIYGKYMQPSELAMDESYEGKGYTIKFDKYELVDGSNINKLYDNQITAKKYEKLLEGIGKIILIYATIKVTDVDAMSGEWFTDYQLIADNTWGNPAEYFLIGTFEGQNLSKKQYENGHEYEVIIPFTVDRIQVTEKDMENIDNWKFLIIWSQNPVVYTRLY